MLPGPAPVAAAASRPADSGELPTVDLEVFFDFGTSRITPASMPTLVALGLSLNDARLADQTFIIGGYTDSKGRPEFNLKLSQARADAVRNYLITEHKVEPKRLIAIGYGKNHFKNAADTQASENRRVQIINWTTRVR